MIGFIIGIAFLSFMFWIGLGITGAILATAIWLFIKIPLMLITWTIGLALCCTIILLPLGLWFFRTGLRFVIL